MSVGLRRASRGRTRQAGEGATGRAAGRGGRSVQGRGGPLVWRMLAVGPSCAVSGERLGRQLYGTQSKATAQ